jgi:hypothetical protein
MLSEELLSRLQETGGSSSFLRVIKGVQHDKGLRLALGDSKIRGLSLFEVAWLERLGNEADDWSRVRVAEGFNPDRVRRCRFYGNVTLGQFSGKIPVSGGLALPAGLHSSTVVNCVVGHGALIHEVQLLSNWVIGPKALLFDCGAITCNPDTAFGNDLVLRLGPETGGREIAAYAEIDVEMAAAVARPGQGRHLLSRYASIIAAFREQATSAWGIIEGGACIRNTPTIKDSYIGPHASVDGATALVESTLLSSEDEPTRVESGACVKYCLLQWGSRVSTLAVVDCAVLCEYSSVERHAKVTHSLLGPNTSVGAAEVSSTLLGSSVSCHHQALLVATLWPEGRGNVAYGAKVGCNHTTRAPDQECWVGEGLFFGLGANLKFPCDFSQAPYTVIGCGITLPPQRLTFPFSLVTSATCSPPGVSTACNEILPGWVLSTNWFALERAEWKLRARDRARRMRIDYRVFRPETMRLVQKGLHRLQSIGQIREVYTDNDVVGLGKNFMREAVRLAAIDAYHLVLSRYALLGLKERIQSMLGHGEVSPISVLEHASSDPNWEHQRQLLVGELGVRDVLAGLAHLPNVMEQIANEVECSRLRDGARGPRIIPDYALVHESPERDELVCQAHERARLVRNEVEQLLDKLGRRSAFLCSCPDEPCLPLTAERMKEANRVS